MQISTNEVLFCDKLHLQLQLCKLTGIYYGILVVVGKYTVSLAEPE